jgi:hypothetical protein
VIRSFPSAPGRALNLTCSLGNCSANWQPQDQAQHCGARRQPTWQRGILRESLATQTQLGIVERSRAICLAESPSARRSEPWRGGSWPSPQDVARGVHTNVHDSERIKTLYGKVLTGWQSSAGSCAWGRSEWALARHYEPAPLAAIYTRTGGYLAPVGRWLRGDSASRIGGGLLATLGGRSRPRTEEAGQ